MKKRLFKPVPVLMPIVGVLFFFSLLYTLLTFTRITVVEDNANAIEYYQNEENYKTYSAAIYSCDYSNYLSFNSIVDDHGHEVSCSRVLGRNKLKIYSDDNEALWDRVNFRTGMEITFVAARDEYLSYPPIVSITVDDEVVLTFEEGKNALIDYLSKK